VSVRVGLGVCVLKGGGGRSDGALEVLICLLSWPHMYIHTHTHTHTHIHLTHIGMYIPTQPT